MRRAANVALEPEPEEVDVGVRLREIRQRRKLTLREVAEAAGVSESFVSQVERGRTNASLGSLQKIAAALGLTIGEFFDSGSSRRAQVLRKDDRPSLGDDERSRTFLLTPAPFENIEAFVGQFPQGGSTGDEQYVHGDSEELMVVISGRVLCQLENKEHVLSAGDSLHYRSSMPHRVVNVGDEPAEVLWVTSPPAY